MPTAEVKRAMATCAGAWMYSLLLRGTLCAGDLRGTACQGDSDTTAVNPAAREVDNAPVARSPFDELADHFFPRQVSFSTLQGLPRPCGVPKFPRSDRCRPLISAKTPPLPESRGCREWETPWIQLPPFLPEFACSVSFRDLLRHRCQILGDGAREIHCQTEAVSQRHLQGLACKVHRQLPPLHRVLDLRLLMSVALPPRHQYPS